MTTYPPLGKCFSAVIINNGGRKEGYCFAHSVQEVLAMPAGFNPYLRDGSVTLLEAKDFDDHKSPHEWAMKKTGAKEPTLGCIGGLIGYLQEYKD